MEQNNIEEEIDLKELVLYVLKGWRTILLVGIVFAVLLATFKFIPSYHNSKNLEMVEENQKEYEEELDTYEMQKDIIEGEEKNIEEKIENQKKYLDESILMQINPYDCKIGTLTFYVDSDYKILVDKVYQNPDYSSALVAAYAAIIDNGEALKNLSESLHQTIDLSYLNELITVYRDGNGTTNLININIMHTDEKIIKEIMDIIKEEFLKKHQDLVTEVGAHELSVVNESVVSTVSTDIKIRQDDANTQMNNLQVSLAAKQLEAKDLIAPVKQDSSLKAALVHGIKYFMGGGVLGIFLTCLVMFLLFFINDKITSGIKVKKRFDLKVLGELTSLKKHRYGHKIDLYLEKLSGGIKSGSEEDFYGRVEANVAVFMEEVSSMDGEFMNKKILISGNVEEEQINGIYKKLVGLAKQNGFELSSSGGITNTAEALKAAVICDALILVKKKNKSTMSELEQELETASDMGKKVVGVILL